MNKSKKTILFWAPRLLTILYAIFLSIFALDVFNGGYGIWKTLLDLFLHLIPAFLILIILIFSWKWEWVGSIFYIFLGAYYIFTNWHKLRIDVFFLVPFPLFLIGVLFLIGWLKKKEVNAV
ncbi:MAG: hypothetical protein P4L35_09060 [Ignavibacteriaceae bacterium]|nr:hypothetical protein [Ignavibacteriaceae bacterium]